jgi:hypothetical protein
MNKKFFAAFFQKRSAALLCQIVPAACMQFVTAKLHESD